jgi:hypothetical protein
VPRVTAASRGAANEVRTARFRCRSCAVRHSPIEPIEIDFVPLRGGFVAHMEESHALDRCS